MFRTFRIATYASLLALSGGFAASATAAELNVVASFSIIADLAKNVGGERVEVKTLVGPDGDAHVYEPRPADAAALEAANVVLVNGLELEGFMKRLIETSGTKAPVVEVTKGIEPLKAEEEHHHDHEGGEKKEAGHEDHHHHGEFDPHAWQDVGNMKIYVANIRDALTAADPANKSTFEINATAYLAELEALDAEIKMAVARVPADRRKAITSHVSFAYFVKAYGTDFISPQGVSTEAEASAKDVARIIRQVKSQKIPAVFLENVVNPRLIEQIARETGAKIGGRLFSDALSDAAGPAATYIAMMKHNISQIEKALDAGPT